ncbi:hypothetical protein [Pyruvatibacter mobilis]|uniref:hypothetical protein n=1 Tax=Pyruvatibacter mobilis TaxID=1712261 RepID=UPI003BAB4454
MEAIKEITISERKVVEKPVATEDGNGLRFAFIYAETSVIALFGDAHWAGGFADAWLIGNAKIVDIETGETLREIK